MRRFLKSAVPLAVLPALLAACGGGSSNDAGTSPAAVSVSETVDKSTVIVGDKVTWTITATNRGGSPTTIASTLSAVVPSDLTSVTVTASGANCGSSASPVNCTIDAGMKAGASATIVISGTTSILGTLTSSVTTLGAATGGCVSTTDCSSTTTVTAKPAPANVSVAASVDATSAIIGTTINWTLTATNTGGATTAPITLTDTLPATGIGAVTVTPTGATCNPVSGNTLTCTIPAGLAGTNGKATVKISAPATAAGSLVNTVAPGTGASCSSAANCTTTTTVSTTAAPSVTVSSSVNATSGKVGDAITWTLTAINSGSGVTTAPITLTDTLPASGIGAISVTPTGATCTAVSGNTLTCTVPAGLAISGGKATVVLATSATANGSLVNTVAPGAGASCASASTCTTTTVISSGTGPTPIAGACGVMIDAATLNTVFGGSTGQPVTLGGLGTTSSGVAPTGVYLAGLSGTSDPATVESWPGKNGGAPGPVTGAMVAATGTQFICASQNGDTTTGASATTKYTSTLTNPTSGSPTSLPGNIQISKQVGNPGFVMFNLPSLTNFSFEFFRSGSNGYQLDYSLDGTTWVNITTTSPSRSTCTNSICMENNLLTTSPNGSTSFTAVAPIKQPVLLRLSNINTSGTMIIQKLMIKP